MKISMKKKTMHVFSKSATQKSDVRYKKEKKTPLSKKNENRFDCASIE